MFKNRIYKLTIIILPLILFVFLIIENYSIKQKIAESECRLRVIDKSKNDDRKVKEFGFTEILEGLSEKERIKISSLKSRDNKEATAELEIEGGVQVIKSTLEDIKNKDNYQRTNSIKIDKDENNNSTAKVNIDFIKNR